MASRFEKNWEELVLLIESKLVNEVILCCIRKVRCPKGNQHELKCIQNEALNIFSPMFLNQMYVICR